MQRETLKVTEVESWLDRRNARKFWADRNCQESKILMLQGRSTERMPTVPVVYL